MAAARNVSAAARMTDRPSPRIAAGELADRRGLAGPVDADDEDDGRARRHAGRGVQAEVARDEERRQLGPDRRLGAARVAPRAGPLDQLDRQRGPDVAGDQRLLDVVPGRAAGVAAHRGSRAAAT